MSTRITTLKKGHSIFVVRFFSLLTILTHDLFYYRSSLPQKTHTHSHPGRPQRRYLSSKRHIIIVGLSLGNHIVHPAWEFACEHISFSPFYCIICLFFIVFQFRLSASRVFCKIFTLFRARSPSRNFTCFCFQKYSSTHAPTLTSTRTLPLRHSNSPTECCMPLS